MSRFISIVLALAFAVAAFWGLGKAYSYVEDVCLVHESKRSDDDITQSEYIIFGTAADCMPLSHYIPESDDGECRYITSLLTDEYYTKQIDIIFAQTVAKETGLKLRIAYIPREELVDALESGKVDFISSCGLDENAVFAFYKSKSYYTLNPVLVFGDSSPGKLKNIESIKTYEDYLLADFIDKSKLPVASWHNVSSYENLVAGIDGKNVFLSEISCLQEGQQYKEIDVVDNYLLECSFLCRKENSKLQLSLNNAIERVKSEGKEFNVPMQGYSKTNSADDIINSSETISLDEIYNAFGNNHTVGYYSFKGNDGSFFAVSKNTLYNYDNSANLIKTYHGFIPGTSYAIGSKIYTLDSNSSKICRVLDLESGNTNTIELKTKIYAFKNTTLKKAHKFTKDKSGRISYDDFIGLLSLKAKGGVKFIDENYVWKNCTGYFTGTARRYDRKYGTTKKHGTFSLFGATSIYYQVFEECGYSISNNLMYCYDFKGDPKIISTEENIGNPISYILDKTGTFYVITNNENQIKIYRWKIDGFCDEIYSTDKQLNAIYDAEENIVVYYGESFMIIDKNSGKVLVEREVES